jgi:hypothetical protein
MFTQESFARVKSLGSAVAVGATADTVAVNGQNISIVCTSGNLWLNPLATAVANSTAYLLTQGEGIDLCVDGNLSLISDGSGATYKYIIWKHMGA